MRFDVITIFPGMFESPLSDSILARAQRNGLMEVAFHDPRDRTTDRHRSVDDEPFGGGGGMVMTPKPLVETIELLRADESAGKVDRVIALTPAGRLFDQRVAVELAQLDRIAIVCGRYEGMDQRVLDGWTDEELSIGDYVISGGELAAMVIIDAVTRLIPGSLGNPLGAWEETHSDGALEHPAYTRPREFRGREVPAPLLSGNHAAIERWRRAEALARTRDRRPDLFEQMVLDDRDEKLLAERDRERKREGQ